LQILEKCKILYIKEQKCQRIDDSLCSRDFKRPRK
jgi:hypothetical protein